MQSINPATHPFPPDEPLLDAAAACDELWEVFLLDEETAEPEPQEGDFWGRLDEEGAQG